MVSDAIALAEASSRQMAHCRIAALIDKPKNLPHLHAIVAMLKRPWRSPTGSLPAMKTMRPLPEKSSVWVWAFLPIVLIELVGIHFYPRLIWIAVIPVALVVFSIVDGIRSHHFTRCPECGQRIHPHEEMDPLTGKRWLCYDCRTCDIEWVAHEIHENSTGD